MYEATGYYRPAGGLHHVHARRGRILRGLPACHRAHHRHVRARLTAALAAAIIGTRTSARPVTRGAPRAREVAAALLPELSRLGTETRLSAGEVLWREGDPGDSVALLVEGTIEVVHLAPEGEEVVLRTVEGGAVVGEIAGTDGGARSATVRARTPVRLLKIPAPDFRLLLRRRPDLLEELYWIQVERVRNLTRQVTKTHHRAITDPLTRLYNFGFFRERLEIEVDRAAQTGDLVSLVIFDIDHFKNVQRPQRPRGGERRADHRRRDHQVHRPPRRHHRPLRRRGVRGPALRGDAPGGGGLRRRVRARRSRGRRSPAAPASPADASRSAPGWRRSPGTRSRTRRSSRPRTRTSTRPRRRGRNRVVASEVDAPTGATSPS